MVAIDKSHQEWAKIYIDAAKEGVTLPPPPNITDILMIAKQAITSDINMDASAPKGASQVPQVNGPAATGISQP